jgi:hypothetical protein
MESKLIDEIKKIKLQINEFQKKLLNVKYELFMQRIITIINSDVANVENITFTSNNLNWTITYKCLVTYDENNYNHNEESETETQPINKWFDISFGKNKKYFINGNQNRFKVYRNSQNTLRILNADYTADLDIEEQETLVKEYSLNTNIPEWFAIKIFLFMIENEWSDENIIAYLDL